MLAKSTLLCYNNYSDKKRVIICVLKGILDVCFSVKSAHNVETKKMSLAKSPIISGFFATQTAIFLCTKTQM